MTMTRATRFDPHAARLATLRSILLLLMFVGAVAQPHGVLAAVPTVAAVPATAASGASPWIEELCVAPKKDEIEKAEADPAERARKIKAVEFEVCPRWIRHHYPSPALSDQLILVRESVDHQKDVAVASFWRTYRWQQRQQWALVLLGLTATVLSAWASRAKPDQTSSNSKWVTAPQTMSFLAMVLTSTITAIGTMASFYDLQGTVERHAKVWNAMGVLQSRIDAELVADVVAGKTGETPKKVEGWIALRDKTLLQAGEEWANALKAKPSS